MSVLCVLPARLESRRLPRKPLREIRGRPLVEWSWRAARRVPAFDAVWVATDSDEVAAAVRGVGGRAVLTDPDHASGTDRVAEAAERPEARRYDVVVNWQADEPFLPPGPAGRAARTVQEGEAGVATLACPLRSRRAWRSPSVVKVVRDRAGDALYFSRAPVPWPRDGEPAWPPDTGGAAPPSGEGDPSAGTGEDWPWLRHVGLYVFARDALARWTELPPSPLEGVERLEQLRALEAGLEIRVVVGPPVEPGVDEPEDLERAERIVREDNHRTWDEAHV
jgi:3-deoxy-manno-octulosonate cytidylyltransferase (CMP-KDO synthetase)